MKIVEGVVVALYKERERGLRFAVLRRTAGWEGWELVKGQKEDSDQSDREAAVREIQEETGIEPESLKPLDMTHAWTYDREGVKHRSEYTVFVARAPDDAHVDVSANEEEEHSQGYFLNYRDARDILRYENQRELLNVAVDRIERGEGR